MYHHRAFKLSLLEPKNLRTIFDQNCSVFSEKSESQFSYANSLRSILTLTLRAHIFSLTQLVFSHLQNFQVTSFLNLLRIVCFIFFPIENKTSYTIWLPQNRSMSTYRHYLKKKLWWPHVKMQYAKFRENWSTGSWEKISYFYHLWAWQPSWTCNLNITD